MLTMMLPANAPMAGLRALKILSCMKAQNATLGDQKTNSKASWSPVSTRGAFQQGKFKVQRPISGWPSMCTAQDKAPYLDEMGSKRNLQVRK